MTDVPDLTHGGQVQATVRRTDDGEVICYPPEAIPEYLRLFESETERVGHTGDAQAGFDLTGFGDAETFCEFLEDIGIDPYWDYFRVEVNGDRYYYTWSNGEILVVCGNNPITGEYREPESRPNEKGYASYIGIEGEYGIVQRTYDTIGDYAVNIKDRSKNNRDFI